MIDLRKGRWEDVLADVAQVDCVVTDPPYGERCHAKQRHGRRQTGFPDGNLSSRGLPYAAWGGADVDAFVNAWAPRCAGWFCAFTSHDLVPAYEAALARHDRYVFAPLACVQRAMNVRLAGDGPSNWTTWLIVARPRAGRFAKWGSLPGAYVGSPVDPGENALDRSRRAVAGGKPVWLMRAIVRDYSRPGDLVCDPCAGGATTLLAAAIEGRRAIGAEVDPKTHAAAAARIARGYTPTLFAVSATPEKSSA